MTGHIDDESYESINKSYGTDYPLDGSNPGQYGNRSDGKPIELTREILGGRVILPEHVSALDPYQEADSEYIRAVLKANKRSNHR